MCTCPKITYASWTVLTHTVNMNDCTYCTIVQSCSIRYSHFQDWFETLLRSKSLSGWLPVLGMGIYNETNHDACCVTKHEPNSLMTPSAAPVTSRFPLWLKAVQLMATGSGSKENWSWQTDRQTDRTLVRTWCKICDSVCCCITTYVLNNWLAQLPAVWRSWCPRAAAAQTRG